MTIKALEKASELWQNPQELIDYWASSAEKAKQEALVRDLLTNWLAGDIGCLVDVGCGVGRYAEALNELYTNYYGFDQSSAMIAEAIYRYTSNTVDTEFACVDIMNFQGDGAYDTLICIDVLHHQNNPAEAMRRICNIWKADDYVFTLLVGAERQDLFNSTVISFDEFMTIYDFFDVMDTHIQRFDDNNFSWVVLHI